LKFIHAADFHLCGGFLASSLLQEIAQNHRDQLWSDFLAVVRACETEKADVLLIAGDLFEAAYARVTDVKRIAEAFARIPSTRVFIAPGDLDADTEGSYYGIMNFPANVHIFRGFESIALPELNTVIHGFGWQEPSYDSMPFSMPALDKSMANLLCLHADTTGSSGAMPISEETLIEAGFDYVALGHLHKARQVAKNIYYCGSPEPINFGEEGRHGFVTGDIGGEGGQKKLSLAFTMTNQREFITAQIKVTAEMDEAAIKESIRLASGQNASKNIFRLVFTGIAHPHIDVASIMAEVKDDFYSVDFYDRTVPDYDIKKIYQDNKDNIIGKFIYSLTQDATKDPIAYKALLSGIEALLYRQEGIANQ